MDAPGSPASDSASFTGLGLGRRGVGSPPVAETEFYGDEEQSLLSNGANRPPAWRDLLGAFTELPIILGGNEQGNYYELKPMLEYVYFWQLTREEIDSLLRDKKVTERDEVVLAKLDGIDRPVVCVDPSILPRIANRVDRRLGLMPSVARTSRALALRDGIASGASVIVVPAVKSACQRSYERRQAKRAEAPEAL